MNICICSMCIKLMIIITCNYCVILFCIYTLCHYSPYGINHHIAAINIQTFYYHHHNNKHTTTLQTLAVFAHVEMGGVYTYLIETAQAQGTNIMDQDQCKLKRDAATTENYYHHHNRPDQDQHEYQCMMPQLYKLP